MNERNVTSVAIYATQINDCIDECSSNAKYGKWFWCMFTIFNARYWFVYDVLWIQMNGNIENRCAAFGNIFLNIIFPSTGNAILYQIALI